MTKKILIATGGTGGHIFPAYSLANYFLNKNFNVKLTIDKRGLKYLKGYKNLKFVIIPSSPLSQKNFFSFLLSIFFIVVSTIKSFIFLLFERPSIVIGMGGYSSFPTCIAASILRIRFVIYENNLIIGKANKYLLPFTKKIFVSYKDIEGIKNKYINKVVVLGNIIRQEIIDSVLIRNSNSEFNNIKILVLGGSQAAKIFAEKLPQIFEKLKNSGLKIKIYQQCHQEQTDKLSQFYKRAEIDYETFNFTDKILDYYLRVNLVITRSGASVLGELINIKLPFISIPLPSSADNHQYKNAKFYQKKGLGYLIEEKDIENKLFELIKLIFIDKSALKNIISKQNQYSDKKIFSNLNIQINKIIHEKS